MFPSLNPVLILCSALSFLGYGSACFLSPYMKREFARYRLAAQRTLVGGLQWCAAIGLALMMLVAVGVRIKIQDTLLKTIPALIHLAPDTYLCPAAS